MPAAAKFLFIDARRLGYMVDRTHREPNDDDIKRIVGTHHAWRDMHGGYEDKPGFCKSTSLEEVLNQGHALTPGRYVAAEPRQDESQPFPEMMARLAARVREQQAEGFGPDAVISKNPEQLGFGDRQ